MTVRRLFVFLLMAMLFASSYTFAQRTRFRVLAFYSDNHRTGSYSIRSAGGEVPQ